MNSLITTEGILINDIVNIPNEIADGLQLCYLCKKYYNEDMVIYDNNEEPQCHHCMFWLNYSEERRTVIDGYNGIYIADYILRCKDNHIQDKCIRQTDSGGCFICEYKSGIEIDNIKYNYKLYSYKENNSNIIYI